MSDAELKSRLDNYSFSRYRFALEKGLKFPLNESDAKAVRFVGKKTLSQWRAVGLIKPSPNILVDRELLVDLRDDLKALLTQGEWAFQDVEERHNTLSDILGLERLK